MQFIYKNIQFQKYEKGDWVVVRGEIYNNSNTKYNSVAFRLIIFVKGMQVITTTITINHFAASSGRFFEKQIEALNSKLINSISRYEINPVGAY